MRMCAFVGMLTFVSSFSLRGAWFMQGVTTTLPGWNTSSVSWLVLLWASYRVLKCRTLVPSRLVTGWLVTIVRLAV